MNWAVVRVNDDGRRQVVNDRMCALAAEKVAGALRDQSAEEEIAEGWNYLPVVRKGLASCGDAGGRQRLDPNGSHVQTLASDSRAPGVTHLPVASGPPGKPHGRSGTAPTGVGRMQVPSEPRDVQKQSRPVGRQQSGRTRDVGMAPPRTAR